MAAFAHAASAKGWSPARLVRWNLISSSMALLSAVSSDGAATGGVCVGATGCRCGTCAAGPASR
eukprot:8792648-Lingulodinium_polyedra.AAC.1